MKIAKRCDDYLPGETRKQYVKRRSVKQKGTLTVYWPTCFVDKGGTISMTNGTFAGPKTKEYRRLKEWPHVEGHIEKIDAMFEEKGK